MLRKLGVAGPMFLLPGLLMSAAGPGYAAAAVAAPAAQNQSGAQTWNAIVGHEIFTETGDKPTWQAQRYYPSTLTINAGDTIVWKHDTGEEPHTVTFIGADNRVPDFAIPEDPAGGGEPQLLVNPEVFSPAGGPTFDGSSYANSGWMRAGLPNPRELRLTFTKPGTYEYFCWLHAIPQPDGTLAGMKAQVVVQEAGSPYPRTQAQVEADAKAAMQADEQLAAKLEPEAKKVVGSSRPGPNGTTIHRANAGYYSSLETTLEYMRFSLEDMVIKQGDTVEWTAVGPLASHTVTFGEEPEDILLEVQSGQPKAYVNPMTFPTESTTHTGTGYYNSGNLIGPAIPADQGVQAYSLTFNQPGRYEYICIFHYHIGMDGNVTVQARTGVGQQAPAAGMPRTGSGAAWLTAMLTSGLLLVLAGVALRLQRGTKTA